MKQFFGKNTWKIILAIAGVHLLAVLFRDGALALPILVLLFIVTFVVSIKSLPAGVFIALSEVFVGGHGHLIDANVGGFSLSIRMVFFSAVMLAWFILWVKKDVTLTMIRQRETPWVLLILAVVFGTLIGFLQNEPGKAFDDMNGFLAIGYLLPFLSIDWKSNVKRDLLQVLAASVLWLVLFTLGLAFAFNHLDGKLLSHVYTFVRDARLAEITLQKDIRFGGEANPAYWYRIFMQSHYYVVTLFLLFLSAIFLMWREQRIPDGVKVMTALLFGTMALSMSRSFTLGLIAGSICLIPVALTNGSKPFKNVIVKSIMSFGLLVAGCIIVAFVSLVPPKANITAAAFYKTSGDIDRDLAISSRWQLLPEMMSEIWSSPIIGSGFGEEVTFISDDPRVRAMNETGEWTTYRFEWGWQDVWLKMGLLGLAAYVMYAYTVGKATLFTIKKHGHIWLAAGLGSGIVMLYVSHVFTPFLNHPIGIIAMMLPIPFLDWGILQRSDVRAEANERIRKPQVKMAPVVSMEEEG